MVKSKKKTGPPYKKPLVDPDLAVLTQQMGEVTVSEVYKQSFLSRSTIANWKKGKTRRPSHMTMIGIAASKGLVWRLVKD
jgi:hypothetical protein